jgi:nucleotide-binding universal stress UspA family protein
MKTIIVPTDFSSAAENAMYYAASLAQQVGGSILLLHVYQMPVGMVDMPVMMVSAEEIKKNVDKSLEDARLLLEKRFPGVNVSGESRMGDVVDELNEFCDMKDTLAVVIGTKGFKGIEKLLFGNTTIAIVRNCKLPVISVPARAKPGSPKNAVLATDLENINEVPGTKIIELVKALNLKLHLVHIQSAKKTNGHSVEQLAELLNEVQPVSHTVADEDVTHGLQQYIEQNNIDLLFVLPHKHNLYERLFFKLHTEGLIQKMPIPVCCV